MLDYLLSGDVIVFTIPALVGTLFFALRLALAAVGAEFGDHAGGLDLGHAGAGGLDGLHGGGGLHTGDAGADDPTHHDSTGIFKFLSIQAITAFAMGFGWGGFAGVRSLGLHPLEAAAVGVLTGAGFVWLLTWLLNAVYALQSSGNIALGDAVGRDAAVYIEVPGAGAGQGQVSVVVNQRQRTLNARTDGQRLERGAAVRILKVNPDNTVQVARISPGSTNAMTMVSPIMLLTTLAASGGHGPTPLTLAQLGDDATKLLPWLGVGLGLLLLLLFVFGLVVKQYKRCPSNRILVVYGRVGSSRASKCLHGGGTFVVPLIQDYAYLSLEPIVIEIPLEGALSLNNIRVNVPSTFTVGVSTDQVLMNNAAERLLMLNTQQVRDQAQDIILGQLRLVIATLSIEEINKDREKFMGLINENVAQEINKIGLELINVNIRDITDESGYISAIGQRAAAEAINRARVEVAQQVRDGETGEAIAVRERTVNVAREHASAAEGEKHAEQKRRIAVAALEAEAVTGEAQSRRDQEIALAERQAETVAARKLAEQEQRIRVASAEAKAIEGENLSRAQMAESTAKLREVEAEAKRRAEVAAAKAREQALRAEREQELARLAKEVLAPQEIQKQQIAIAASAEAEKRRLEAHGEADAILAKYQAEAEGIRQVLEAKAEGYRQLMEAAANNPQVAPTLLLIEQLPKLVAEQVKAIANLKIDKITVWDGGRGGPSIEGKTGARGATADFLAGLIGSLPQVHELAEQAGIELPGALGRVRDGRVDGESKKG